MPTGATRSRPAPEAERRAPTPGRAQRSCAIRRPRTSCCGARARRAAAEIGFYIHFIAYLGSIAFLALINMLMTTTRYPWFLWPALGWGLGLFFHYMGVFGSRAAEGALLRARRRARGAAREGGDADREAGDVSTSCRRPSRTRSAIPIAAAKSLVQQMGEDPQSVENVEYAKVALDELDRVERRISHLLKYAKEEDYAIAPVNLASVVDARAHADARQARRRAAWPRSATTSPARPSSPTPRS